MKAIIFDLDGTLLDSRQTIRRCLNAAIMEFGEEPFEGEDLKQLIGRHLMEILALKGLGTEEVAERYRQIQMDTYHQDMKMYDGVVQMLDLLKKNGLSLGVATMRNGRITRDILNGIGIGHYFDAMVGVDDAERPKPEPDQVVKACRLLGVSEKDAAMVGDTTMDVLSGKAAGCAAIGVSWGNGEAQDLKNAGADHVCDSMKELEQLLLGMI